MRAFLMIAAMMFCFLLFMRILAFLWLPLSIFMLIMWIYSRYSLKKVRNQYDVFYENPEGGNGIFGKFAHLRQRFRERKTHKYYKCKLCRTTLRVPKGKGKIEIICPKCKFRMTKKT